MSVKTLSLFVLAVGLMSEEVKAAREIRSLGGNGWQGSGVGDYGGFGSIRSSFGGWSGSGRSQGGWSGFTRSGNSGGSNGFAGRSSSCGNNGWDTSNVGLRSGGGYSSSW